MFDPALGTGLEGSGEEIECIEVSDRVPTLPVDGATNASTHPGCLADALESMALARGWRRVSEAESAATRGVEAIGQAFQQLLKMRLVDEARTLSQLRIWERYQEKYGADCTRGLAEVLRAALGALPLGAGEDGKVEGEPRAPGRPDSSQWVRMLRGSELSYCIAGWEGPKLVVECSAGFRDLFMTANELAEKCSRAGLLEIYLWASLIRPEEQGDFFRGLADLLFRIDPPNELNTTPTCIDRGGDRRICLVRVRSHACLDGTDSCILLSMYPLPDSKYLPAYMSPGQKRK